VEGVVGDHDSYSDKRSNRFPDCSTAYNDLNGLNDLTST
jgi:hypothetical protein